MKRDKVNKALMVAFGTALLATGAGGCSSGQKPAVLGPAGAGATGTASSSASGSASSSGASSSSSSSAAPSSSAPAAPTTVATSKGGWSYSASVPADTSISAALTAFQNYTALVYEMETKVQHNNDLVNYADGNVLSLMDNFVTQERQLNFVQRGTETVKVTSAVLDSNTKPPVVTITTCTDDTKLSSIVTYGPKKGQSAAASPTSAYPNIYKVHLSADGKWRVNAVTPEPKKTC
jgi:hypothetical protein